MFSRRVLRLLMFCLVYHLIAPHVTAKKVDYRVSQSSDDAEERVSDGNMYLTSSDLELISDGGTAQLVGIRFQNLAIPQGATILSAVIEFETDETNSGSTSVTVRGEDIDDAPTFTSADDNISDRTTTSASVAWNNIPSWSTVSERHQTPDLTSIVQEIVDRAGWSSGNDMVFIITGSGERTAEAYDGEDENAPILRIEFDQLSSTPGGALCYGVPDSNDRFVIVDTTDGTVDTNVGPLGVGGIEAIAIDPDGLDVYGADADELGRINVDTGEFIRLTESFGAGSGSAGNVTFSDVDGLAFDHATGTLWGVHARGGSDALFQIDTDTGAHIPDAFGSGVDYLLISGTGIGTSIDDIAIEPSTGTMYATDTTNSQLITINTSTGSGTAVGSFGGSIDMEGMGFHFDGTLYGTQGRRLYTINTSTGAATQVGTGDTLNVGNDYEAFDCDFTALTRAVIARFRTIDDGGRVRVEWETASEDGTAGFYLYRYDRDDENWIAVHENLLPGLQGSPQGGTYGIIDETAPLRGRLVYALLEVETNGRVITHGPYLVYPTKSSEFATEREKFVRRPRMGRLRATHRESSRKTRRRPKAEARRSLDLKIVAHEPGLQYLSVERVAEALGSTRYRRWVEKNLSRGRISIHNFGEEVSWLGAPDGSGLYFYSPKIDSIYYRDNIYQLRFGPGRRMMQVPSTTPTSADSNLTFVDQARTEEDRIAVTVVAPDPESDYWFWDYLIGGEPGKSFVVDIPDAGETAAPVAMKLGLYGVTTTGIAGEHHVQVYFNGVFVGEATSTGIGPREVSLEFSQSLVRDGENRVEIANVLDVAPYSIMYVDSIELCYHRLYRAENDTLLWRGDKHRSVSLSGFSSPAITLLDITDVQRPIKIMDDFSGTVDSGGEYRRLVIPSPDRTYLAVGPEGVKIPEVDPWKQSKPSLRRPRNRADYLILAPSQLVEAAKRLADYRAGRGLATLVVDIEHVYSEFSHGFPTPHAIREFLAYSHEHWRRAPRYVALVGSGSFDYRDLLGIGDNLVPTLMTRGIQGIFASDNTLAAVVGGGGRLDLTVGRIPVSTETELDAYLEKVRAYEASGARGLVPISDYADIGGLFAEDSRRLTAPYRGIVPVREIALDNLPFQAARGELWTQFRAGVEIITYAGHGGLDRFSAGGLLMTSDVPELDNFGHTPIVISLSCSTNRFEVPGFVTLGEALVNQPDGGAVAVWAPTGLTAHEQSLLLAESFLDAYYHGSERIGDAIRKARKEYSIYSDSERLLRLFTLLGDPALELPN
jgi:hypothetical protein